MGEITKEQFEHWYDNENFEEYMGDSVEDEKVSVDGLQEKIEAIEDKVQSVDILAFNKI